MCFFLLYFNIRKQSDSLHSICKLFSMCLIQWTITLFPCFVYWVITFVPYTLLLITVLFPWRRTSFCSRIHMEKIRKITQDDNHFSLLFTPPPPIFAQGGRGVHKFCIYFWKGWRGTWTSNGGVRHTIFSHHLLTKQHSTYYMMTFI